ncbi:MAG: hypothetical protein JOZ43_06355 [Acidobacteriales bacterium]|nr:hypothetical protein [Terriglobales bacterium]
MQVTCLQLEIRDGDPKRNLEHALAMLHTAPESDVYLLPELFTTGYAHRTWESAAREHTPEAVAELERFARERDTSIVAGTIALNENGKLVNRLWHISPQRRQHYDKIHLIAAFREPELLERGEKLCAAELHDLHVSFSVCFDLRFPELYRAAALDGAEAFFVISEWPAKRMNALLTLATARAMENQCFVVLCNRTGIAQDGTKFEGGSRIIDPEGDVIAQALAGEGLCSGEIDSSVVRSLREQFPVLQCSRRSW